MDEKVNDTIALVQDKMEGQTQMSIRVGVNTDSMLVQPKMEIPGLDLVTGVQHYEEEVRGSRFTVAASSFFQVNTSQLSRAVDEVRELLELRGDEVMVDAYCGVGVFAVLMSPYVKRVVGIEESVSAIEDANLNLNGATNVEFIEGKTEHVMADWQDEDSVDVLLLDPPRVGCHPDVLESVKKLQPKKVLMISCEPAAMARDLDLLCDGGMYKLDTVRPVDMFPQTRHVETISVLSFQGIQG
jgi:23S rRNA (uracil1939-C5)-methyltransferase